MININSEQLSLQASGKSVGGPVRSLNQDAIYYDISHIGSPPKPLGIFIVSDGMGGLQSADFASVMATSVIVSALTTSLSSVLATDEDFDGRATRRRIKEAITDAIIDANASIYRPAGPDGRMGAAVTLAVIYDGIAHIANVGHGRIYVLHRDRAVQVTLDHTLAAELAREGHIERNEIIDHPHRKVLSRALGLDSEVKVDHHEVALFPGDRLLLCTDGLWMAFPDESELARLSARASLEDLVELLVNEASERDGSDNISAVLVGVEPEAEISPIGSFHSGPAQRGLASDRPLFGLIFNN